MEMLLRTNLVAPTRVENDLKRHTAEVPRSYIRQRIENLLEEARVHVD
jgi:hypothetical protein